MCPLWEAGLRLQRRRSPSQTCSDSLSYSNTPTLHKVTHTNTLSSSRTFFPPSSIIFKYYLPPSNFGRAQCNYQGCNYHLFPLLSLLITPLVYWRKWLRNFQGDIFMFLVLSSNAILVNNGMIWWGLYSDYITLLWRKTVTAIESYCEVLIGDHFTLVFWIRHVEIHQKPM